MLPDTTKYYINSLPTTREQIDLFVGKYENEIEEGNENPLEIAIQLKAMEELVNKLRKSGKIRDLIMNEAEKHPEKRIVFHGNVIEKTETGTRYDYSNCWSAEWDELNKQFENIKILKSEQEKKLRAIKEQIVKTETGEIINPPIKTSNTYIKITLK